MQNARMQKISSDTVESNYLHRNMALYKAKAAHECPFKGYRLS